MGILRMLLALSVLLLHTQTSNSFVLAGGMAVPAFFIISGFYMALILNEKYTGKHSYKLFITNRFLRLYPLYYLASFLMLLFVLGKFFFHVGGSDNALWHIAHYQTYSAHLLYIATVINYILRNLTLIISADYFFPFSKDTGYLLIQQAWTLQIEFLFYLIAPFIVRRYIKFILLITTLAFVLRIFLLQTTMGKDLLTQQFGIFFCYFLLGIISYKGYAKLKQKDINKTILLTIYLLMILFTCFFLTLPIPKILFGQVTSEWIYYAFVMAAIPFLFYFTKNNAVDRFIGEMSFACYLIHFIIIKLLENISYFPLNSTKLSITAIIITLLSSALLVKLIDEPIDKIRQQRLVSAKGKKKLNNVAI